MSNNHENKLIPNFRFPEFEYQEEWKEKYINDLCKFTRGPFGGALKKEIFVSEGYAVYEQSHAIYGDFTSFRYFISEEKFNELKRFSVLPKDIIMSCSGTMGKFSIVPEKSKEGVINQALLKLTVKSDYEVGFIKTTLELPVNQNKLLSQSAGGAIKNVVEVAQIKEITLFIPSIREQQKIAACLSSLDEVITAENQKLDILKDHKKGLLQNLLPQEAETVPKLRFRKFEDCGEWEKNILKEIAIFVNEKTRLENISMNSYISTENLLPDYAGVALASKLPSSGNFTKYRKGDVLVSNIRPYLKKVWFADKDGACSNDVIVIRGNSCVSDEFLSLLLRNDAFINYIMKGAEGVKMPRGDKDSIREYQVIFPKDKTEQQIIADTFSSVDELINAQSQKVEALKLHKKGLLQGLFPDVNEIIK